MLNCDAIKLDLSAYRDGALSPQERAVVEQHLSECVACKAEISEIERARAALLSLPKLKAPSGLSSKIKAQLHVEPSQPKLAQPLELCPAQPRRARFSWLAMVSGMAATLAIGLMCYVYFFKAAPDSGLPAPELAQKEPASNRLKDAQKELDEKPESKLKVTDEIKDGLRKAPPSEADPAAADLQADRKESIHSAPENRKFDAKANETAKRSAKPGSIGFGGGGGGGKTPAAENENKTGDQVSRALKDESSVAKGTLSGGAIAGADRTAGEGKPDKPAIAPSQPDSAGRSRQGNAAAAPQPAKNPTPAPGEVNEKQASAGASAIPPPPSPVTTEPVKPPAAPAKPKADEKSMDAPRPAAPKSVPPPAGVAEDGARANSANRAELKKADDEFLKKDAPTRDLTPADKKLELPKDLDGRKAVERLDSAKKAESEADVAEKRIARRESDVSKAKKEDASDARFGLSGRRSATQRTISLRTHDLAGLSRKINALAEAQNAVVAPVENALSMDKAKPADAFPSRTTSVYSMTLEASRVDAMLNELAALNLIDQPVQKAEKSATLAEPMNLEQAEKIEAKKPAAPPAPPTAPGATLSAAKELAVKTATIRIEITVEK